MQAVKHQSAAAFCQEHGQAYIGLTYEIAEAPRTSEGKDLGYCILQGSTVIHDGEIHTFKGTTEAYAYILKTFWLQ